MHCTHCGQAAATEARFCRECGQPLDAPVIGDADFYRAAIGPNNTAYYLQRFAEADRRGGKAGIGWHWPAFFITFYWLLYRKMWLNAFLYWISPYVLMVPLVAAMMLAGNEDAGVAVFAVGYLLYIAAFMLLPPLFGNALYYRHCKAKIAEAKQAGGSAERQLGELAGKGGTSNVAIFILLGFGVLMMLAVLAAIAIPAYQDYTVRAKIAQGLDAAAAAKLAVAETYAETGAVPADNAQAGYVFDGAPPEVRDIRIEQGGVVRVRMAVDPIDGGAIVLEPSEGADGAVEWRCYSPDIEKRYLPSACRE